MTTLLSDYYLVIKALHIIAVLSWMAGLLYLPRLFVYHAEAGADEQPGKTFTVMEYRLLRFIMNPAMIAAWLFGLLMIAANPALLSSGWMHLKLGCAVLMSVAHMLFARWRRQFAAGKNVRTARFYRFWNEVPTLLMVIIVFMAILKPF